MPSHLGLDRKLVILAALLAPVLSGAIIYYSLRKSHRDVAHLGNVMSWIGFVGWTLAWKSGVLGERSTSIPVGCPEVHEL